MRIQRVTATFIGEHKNCGYENKKEYVLKIKQNKENIRIEQIGCYGNTSPVEYSNIITFLDNWNNVRKTLIK